jgi:hypothetical protein
MAEVADRGAHGACVAFDDRHPHPPVRGIDRMREADDAGADDGEVDRMGR